MNYDNLSMEEFESLYDETDKSIAVLESYLSIMTLEPNAANVAIESLSNIYGSDVSGNYSSVIVNGNVSLEGFGSTLLKIAGNITAPLRKVADETQGYFTFSESTSDDLNALKRQIDRLPSNYKADFTIKNSKYTSLSNNDYVRDYKEYIKVLEENVAYLTSFNEFIAAFTEDDLWNSLKTLGSAVTGYEDHYRTMINRLEVLFKEIVKPKYVTLSGSGRKYKEYNSISLLGMSVVKITVPSEALTKRETFSELKSRGGNYYVSLVRSFPVSPSGTIDFTGMTKSDMDKIISLNLKLTSSYAGFISIKHALSIMGASNNIGDNLNSLVIPIYWFKFLLASYRLMSRISWLIYNTAYPSMNLSKGIIKKSIDILERAVK